MASSYIALDVGSARIGLALANDIARIAAPLTTLTNDDQFTANLKDLIVEHEVEQLVVGWPRGLDGQDTAQTAYVAKFIQELEPAIGVPIHRQDEALTSVKAEDELKHRGRQYDKAEVDSLSAVYILEDYLAEAVH